MSFVKKNRRKREGSWSETSADHVLGKKKRIGAKEVTTSGKRKRYALRKRTQ